MPVSNKVAVNAPPATNHAQPRSFRRSMMMKMLHDFLTYKVNHSKLITRRFVFLPIIIIVPKLERAIRRLVRRLNARLIGVTKFMLIA